jgi:hypothetical protein
MRPSRRAMHQRWRHDDSPFLPRGVRRTWWRSATRGSRAQSPSLAMNGTWGRQGQRHDCDRIAGRPTASAGQVQVLRRCGSPAQRRCATSYPPTFPTCALKQISALSRQQRRRGSCGRARMRPHGCRCFPTTRPRPPSCGDAPDAIARRNRTNNYPCTDVVAIEWDVHQRQRHPVKINFLPPVGLDNLSLTRRQIMAGRSSSCLAPDQDDRRCAWTSLVGTIERRLGPQAATLGSADRGRSGCRSSDAREYWGSCTR